MHIAVATHSGHLETKPIFRSNLRLTLSPPASLDYSDHSSRTAMEEKDLKETNEESRARGVKRSSETKIAKVSTGKEKRPKKAKAAIPAPTIEDSDKIEVSEQSEATPRRRSAARDYLNGRISGEEFQSWVQGLIAARNNKASNNKALSVMEQQTKTPTTMNFPVNPTDGGCQHVWPKALAFFWRGRGQRQQDQHCYNIKRSTTARQDTNCIEFSRQYDGGLQRIHKWQDQC
jgi:hypothetical protein